EATVSPRNKDGQGFHHSGPPPPPPVRPQPELSTRGSREDDGHAERFGPPRPQDYTGVRHVQARRSLVPAQRTPRCADIGDEAERQVIALIAAPKPCSLCGRNWSCNSACTYPFLGIYESYLVMNASTPYP
ncbi:unnamed protein product, partial [Musa acuminata var. zebrina]